MNATKEAKQIISYVRKLGYIQIPDDVGHKIDFCTLPHLREKRTYHSRMASLVDTSVGVAGMGGVFWFGSQFNWPAIGIAVGTVALALGDAVRRATIVMEKDGLIDTLEGYSKRYHRPRSNAA